MTLAAGWCRKMESTERMKRGWKVCGGVVQIRKKDEEEAAAIVTAAGTAAVFVRALLSPARRMQEG